MFEFLNFLQIPAGSHFFVWLPHLSRQTYRSCVLSRLHGSFYMQLDHIIQICLDLLWRQGTCQGPMRWSRSQATAWWDDHAFPTAKKVCQDPIGYWTLLAATDQWTNPLSSCALCNKGVVGFLQRNANKCFITLKLSDASQERIQVYTKNAQGVTRKKQRNAWSPFGSGSRKGTQHTLLETGNMNQNCGPFFLTHGQFVPKKNKCFGAVSHCFAFATKLRVPWEFVLLTRWPDTSILSTEQASTSSAKAISKNTVGISILRISMRSWFLGDVFWIRLMLLFGVIMRNRIVH